MPVASVYPLEKPIDAYHLNKTEGAIALEMEVEGDNLPTIRTKMWTTHGDGSLRLNGMEYVSNGPLPKDKVMESLLNWENRLVKSNATVYESDRTSVHVHMNMQNKTFKEIVQGCVAYFVLENALMRHCGPSRMTNLFCLPLKQSKGQLNALKYISGTVNGTAIRTDTYRYSALNLMALLKFGSIEHRGMRGYYAPEFLNQWATNLYNIFEVASTNFKSPVEVLDYYYGRSFKEYAGTFLSDDMVDTLSRIKDWDIDKDENLPVIGPIIYDTDFDKARPEGEKKRSLDLHTFAPDGPMVYWDAPTPFDNNIRSNAPRRTNRILIFSRAVSADEHREISELRNSYFDWYEQKRGFLNGEVYEDWDEENDISIDVPYEDPGDQPVETVGYVFYPYHSHNRSAIENRCVDIFDTNFPITMIRRYLEHQNIDLWEMAQDYMSGICVSPNGTLYRYDYPKTQEFETREELLKDFIHHIKHEATYKILYNEWVTSRTTRPQNIMNEQILPRPPIPRGTWTAESIYGDDVVEQRQEDE